MAILGLALLSIIIFLGVCNTQQIVLHCTTTWLQPGLDRGFVDRLQKLATENRKQKTDSGVYRVAPATKNSIGVLIIMNLTLINRWNISHADKTHIIGAYNVAK